MDVGRDITIVTATASIPPHLLRQLIRQKGASGTRQIWVFKPRRLGERPSLDLATTPQDLFFSQRGEGLAKQRTVEDHVLRSWYEVVADRRRRGYDEAVVAALEQQGLPRGQGIGISRAGVVERVREAASLGAPITKVAALWLDDVAPLAQSRGLLVADIALEATVIAELVALRVKGSLPKSETEGALVAVIDRNLSPREFADGLELVPASDDRLDQIVEEAVTQHPDLNARAKAGEARAVRAIAGKAMGRMPSPKPDFQRVVNRVEHQIKIEAT